MTRPAQSRPETDPTYTRSARSDVDETLPAGASTPDTPATPGFAPPAEPGEVGILGPYRLVKELGQRTRGSRTLPVAPISRSSISKTRR